jgi:rubredoxin
MEKTEKLLDWQPKAKNILAAGQCPDCGGYKQLFYQLPEIETIVAPDGYLQGGFYCPDCGFANSGAIKLDDPDDG